MESISRISSVLESGMFLVFPKDLLSWCEGSADVFEARDLTLDAAQAARNPRSSTKTPSATQIKKLLDSRNDREVLDGLRKVISVRLPAVFPRENIAFDSDIPRLDETGIQKTMD
jgi:hypothetical protein